MDVMVQPGIYRRRTTKYTACSQAGLHLLPNDGFLYNEEFGVKRYYNMINSENERDSSGAMPEWYESEWGLMPGAC